MPVTLLNILPFIFYSVVEEQVIIYDYILTIMPLIGWIIAVIQVCLSYLLNFPSTPCSEHLVMHLFKDREVEFLIMCKLPACSDPILIAQYTMYETERQNQQDI